MITDILATFARPGDGLITETKVICLAQGDLPAPTDGIGVYEGLWLNVIAFDPVSGLEVTLQHADDRAGPFTDLVKYPPMTAAAGEKVVVAPVPFTTKNWLKLSFSAAARVNALLTSGVDKFR